MILFETDDRANSSQGTESVHKLLEVNRVQSGKKFPTNFYQPCTTYCEVDVLQIFVGI